MAKGKGQEPLPLPDLSPESARQERRLDERVRAAGREGIARARAALAAAAERGRAREAAWREKVRGGRTAA